MKKPALIAKKSYDEKCVKVSVDLSSNGWRGPAIKVQSSVDISIDEARLLASELLALSDAADAMAAKKASAEDRRQAWRDREVASGRMRTISMTGASTK